MKTQHHSHTVFTCSQIDKRRWLNHATVKHGLCWEKLAGCIFSILVQKVQVWLDHQDRCALQVVGHQSFFPSGVDHWAHNLASVWEEFWPNFYRCANWIKWMASSEHVQYVPSAWKPLYESDLRALRGACRCHLRGSTCPSSPRSCDVFLRLW